MTRVFADASFWIALLRPGDQWREAATRARAELAPGSVLVTTDEVLVEFLTAFSGAGPFMRREAAGTVRDILEDPNVRVIALSRDSFLRGLDLYERRLDKSYSLTDCISMNVMRDEALFAALTTDHHFAQEGFTVLIARD